MKKRILSIVLAAIIIFSSIITPMNSIASASTQLPAGEVYVKFDYDVAAARTLQTTYGATVGTASLQFIHNGAAVNIGRAQGDRTAINCPNQNTPWTMGTGPDNASTWEIRLDTGNCEDIYFSASQASTNNAPRDWKLAYRVGTAGNFIPFGEQAQIVNGDTLDNDSLEDTFFNVPLPVDAWNRSVLCIRVYVASDRTVTGGSLGVSGNTSINYIVFTKGGIWEKDDLPPIENVPDDKKLMFSHDAGLYTQSFPLTLSTGYTTGIIRYTTDGSDPKSNSQPYSTPISVYNRTSEPNVLTQYTNIVNTQQYSYTPPTTNIFKGNVIKAQVFTAQGQPLTKVYTRSFFVNPDYYNLPIVSVVTDKDNLFDSNIGIFLWPNSKNKGAEWERPAHVEMFEPDGTTAFSQDMGVRIHGMGIRGCAQKAMRLYARRGYDPDHPTVEYDIFEGRAKTMTGEILTSFDRLLLRQSGQDYNRTMIRDSLFHDLMHDTNIAVQAYRQSVVFVNGEFWGIYNIRERGDEESVSRKYGLNVDNIGLYSLDLNDQEMQEHLFNDYDETDPLQVRDWTAYMQMWDWFNNTASLASDENYAYAQTFMDLDSFIDYYIANTFVHNRDFPGNNQVLWRYRTEGYPETGAPLSASDGRWRWYLKDLDWGFGLYYTAVNDQSFSRLMTTTPSEYNAPWSTMIFRKLMTSAQFRHKFVNRYCDLLNTNFKSDVINAKIDAMANNISGAIPQNALRWTRHFPSGITSWNSSFTVVRSFANGRTSAMYGLFNTHFGYSSTAVINLNTDSAGGYIRINSTDIKPGTDGVTNPSSWRGTYFVNTTQKITAVPQKGYAFTKFIVTIGGSTTESTANPLDITLSSSGATVTAVFEETETGDIIAAFSYTRATANVSQPAYPATEGVLKGSAKLEFYYADGVRASIGRTQADREPVNVPNSNTSRWTPDGGAINANTSGGWVITLDTSNYENIKFTADQGSSNNGPRDFKLAYRIGTEGAFTEIGGGHTPILSGADAIGNTFSDVSLPPVMNNQPIVQLKVYISSEESRGTGAYQPNGGNTSINNIVIAGNAASAGTASLTGRVSSYNPQRETKIELYLTGTEHLAASAIIEALPEGFGQTTQEFTLKSIPEGVYDLVVSKKTHLNYSITGIPVGAAGLDLTMHPDDNINTISLPCGDINEDGFINSSDLSILILPANYNKSISDPEVDPLADLTGSGWVNSSALSVIILPSNYNRTHITYTFSE